MSITNNDVTEISLSEHFSATNTATCEHYLLFQPLAHSGTEQLVGTVAEAELPVKRLTLLCRHEIHHDLLAGLQRFNGIYGDVFTIPDGYITKTTAKVMSLQEPTKKMSKSDENPNASVWILDDKDTIIRKFKRAVTDSDTVVCAREGKDGIINLMSIYSAVTNKSFEEIEAEFAGKGYGDFKTAVGEAVADMLAPMQAEFKRVFADKAYLEDCMKKGAEKAFKASRKTLQKVQKKVGFLTL